MRHFYTSLAGFALLGLALCLAGCGGGSSLAPTGGDTTGIVTIHVQWPAPPSDNRYIPNLTQSFDITITAPDITTPIKSAIARPDTTATLAVPIGSNRVISLMGRGADGKFNASGGLTTIKVFPRQENVANITVAGYEDFWPMPQEIALNWGTKIAWGRVEGILGYQHEHLLGSQDLYSFTAVGGQQYTLTFEVLEASSAGEDGAWIQYSVNDGTTSYGEHYLNKFPPLGFVRGSRPVIPNPVFPNDSLTFTAPTSGTYYIPVDYLNLSTYVDTGIYYRLTVSETGNGSVDMTVF